MKNIRVLRSNVHEMLLLEALINKGKNIILLQDSFQKEKHSNNLKDLKELKESHYQNFLEIQKFVNEAVKLLPTPKDNTSIEYVSKSANQDNVWDIKYYSKNKAEYVSCKLARVEDKAYRLSTQDYSLPLLTDKMKEIYLKRLPGETHSEYAQKHKVSINSIQNSITECLIKIIKNENIQDNKILLRILKERFIGKGDFWRVTKDKVEYFNLYSLNNLKYYDDPFKNKTGTTVTFKVKDQITNQEFIISMRAKLKDGKDKPIIFNSVSITNWAFTVKIEEILSRQ